VFTCVGWQITLCDPIWRVTLCRSEMEFHKELYSFKVWVLTYHVVWHNTTKIWKGTFITKFIWEVAFQL